MYVPTTMMAPTKKSLPKVGKRNEMKHDNINVIRLHPIKEISKEKDSHRQCTLPPPEPKPAYEVHDTVGTAALPDPL